MNSFLAFAATCSRAIHRSVIKWFLYHVSPYLRRLAICCCIGFGATRKHATHLLKTDLIVRWLAQIQYLCRTIDSVNLGPPWRHTLCLINNVELLILLLDDHLAAKSGTVRHYEMYAFFTNTSLSSKNGLNEMYLFDRGRILCDSKMTIHCYTIFRWFRD